MIEDHILKPVLLITGMELSKGFPIYARYKQCRLKIVIKDLGNARIDAVVQLASGHGQVLADPPHFPGFPKECRNLRFQFPLALRRQMHAVCSIKPEKQFPAVQKRPENALDALWIGIQTARVLDRQRAYAQRMVVRFERDLPLLHSCSSKRLPWQRGKRMPTARAAYLPPAAAFWPYLAALPL